MRCDQKHVAFSQRGEGRCKLNWYVHIQQLKRGYMERCFKKKINTNILQRPQSLFFLHLFPITLAHTYR